jgi:uncharacterized iron-regulated protein
VVWKNDVVYIGEGAGNLNAPAAQFETLKGMRIARGSRIAVGFEAVSIALQPILDDFAAGRISDKEFADRTGWSKEPGRDLAAYKPVLDFIAQNKLRALALGLPAVTLAKIKDAGLTALNDEEKKFLPEAPAAASKSKKYLEYLKASFRPAEGMTPAAENIARENYLASVTAADERAGARIADFLTANPGWAVMALAGNGRIIYNAAIPASVKSRIKTARQASFYTVDAAKCPAAMDAAHKNLANYIWYLAPALTPDGH